MAASANGFECTALPGTFGRPAELAMLASACAALDEPRHAATLLHLLRPWIGFHLQFSLGEYCGPASLFAGRLERTCKQFDAAELSFTRAIREGDAAGAPLKVAEARLELAKTLAERGAGDDTAQARALASTVHDFAVEHRIPYIGRPASSLLRTGQPTTTRSLGCATEHLGCVDLLGLRRGHDELAERRRTRDVRVVVRAAVEIRS